MGPEVCSAKGEKLVELVANRMAGKPYFLNVNDKMGAAITNVLNTEYSLPFQL